MNNSKDFIQYQCSYLMTVFLVCVCIQIPIHLVAAAIQAKENAEMKQLAILLMPKKHTIKKVKKK